MLKNKPKALFLLSLVTGFIELAGGIIQANTMLNASGITDVFAVLSLPSADKVNIPLYLTFSAASFAIIWWAGATILKGYTRRGGMIAGLATASALVTLFLPSALGYPSSTTSQMAILLAMILMSVVAFMGFQVRSIEVEKKMLLTPVEIAITAVFSALTAVITWQTGTLLPSPTGGYTNLGDTVLFVAALLFGSKVGGVVGIIGPVVADLLVGYSRWFVTVLAHGSEGFIAGLGRGRNIVIQVVLLAFAGFAMATVYFFVNVFIKGYPVAIISYGRDLFGQALVSIILGLILTKAAERALPSSLKR
jgi:uncharacterized membrane protein